VQSRVARLRAIDSDLARLTVPFEEWETVYRQRLQVERDLLAGETNELAVPAAEQQRDPEPRPPLADRVFALGTAALIAVDAVLLAARLTRSRSRR
jgi:hypothetical protein